MSDFPAKRKKFAAPARGSEPFDGTAVENAEATEGKIEAKRIARIQAAERAGKPFGRAGGDETEPPPDAEKMRVEGNDQFRWIRLLPETEIDPVVPPDHPSKKEIPALAGTPAVG